MTPVTPFRVRERAVVAAKPGTRRAGAAPEVRDAAVRVPDVSDYFGVTVVCPFTQLMLPPVNSLCLPPVTSVSSLVG